MKQLLVFGIIIFLILGLSGCTNTTDNNNDDGSGNNNNNSPSDEHEFDQDWTTITVDDSGWVGIDPMIAVDDDTHPHIAYYDQGNRDLKYAYYDGESWTVETVDSDGDCGEEPGIDIDSNGIPHISYQDKTNTALRYATKINGEWVSTKLDSVDVEIEAMSTSLKVDSNDHIHIAFSYGIDDMESFDGNVFRYAFYDGEEWTIETIRKTGSDCIIDVDSPNIPHISFKGDSEDIDRIMYATKNADVWTTEVVDTTVEADGDTGIAVQSDGTPHIIYHDYDQGLIKYATKNNGEWNTFIIENNQDNQEGIKIDVDDNNDVHVVYSNIQKNSDEGYLVYAKKDGSTWIKENVYFMDNPAIAIDSQGGIHIAHNMCAEGNPLDYCPDYTGEETEIEILKYSKRE